MPREGTGYKKPSGGIQQRKGGPYYNISVTLDIETLNIVNSWPKGTVSERIRWAIKDRYYGRREAGSEELEMLRANMMRLQKRLTSEIGQKRMLESNLYTYPPSWRLSNPMLRFARSAWAAIRHPIATLRRMLKGSD